jgi:diguanylate cyclase (GGDEF)-like protein
MPAWTPYLLTALLLAVLAVARWRVRRLLISERQGVLAVRRRLHELEQANAELEKTNDQLRHYAEHDGLTGLWNHRVILDRLRQEVDRSKRERTPISVIMVDLDLFKNVNDSFGHQVGDRVLKEVATILQRSVRSYDWVGRYGGEEFLLILPTSGFSGARLRAEQLRLAIESARILNGLSGDAEAIVPVTASFGISSGFPLNPEELIRRADNALYRAKDNGRNCVIAMEL